MVALPFVVLLAEINQPVMMYNNDYGNYALFILAAIMGCAVSRGRLQGTFYKVVRGLPRLFLMNCVETLDEEISCLWSFFLGRPLLLYR